MRIRQTRFALAAVMALASMAIGPTVATADDKAQGAIKSYECGDNCYLTIETDDGEELVGMCAAEACGPWNEQAAMPDDMIGKRVEVNIEMGQQTDNDGNLMGEFPAFTDLVFLD